MAKTDIWFISDQHYYHSNVLTFTDNVTGVRIRPHFKDVEEMNEHMIAEHNKLIGQFDKVYFLGDVCFGNPTKLDAVMTRLNGKKRLILGNHDTMDIQAYARHFEKIMSWRQFKDMPYPFIACHYPLHEDGLVHRVPGHFVYNVHGHIHQRSVKLHTPHFTDLQAIKNAKNDPRFICVCVEHTNYKPVHMDELQKEMKSRGI